MKKINHIEMTCACAECDLDCETAHKDGTCTLVGCVKEQPSEEIEEDAVP